MHRRAAREALLRALEPGKVVDDPSAFVLLWTYFQTVGLTDAENRLVATGRSPGPLGPYPARTDDSTYTTTDGAKWLRRYARDPDFDLFALSWLRGLDRLLATQRGTFEHETLAGVSGGRYRVRPLNNWIAQYFETAPGSRAVTTRPKQGLALAQHCRHFTAVDVEPKGGLTLRILHETRWASPLVRDRLGSARDSNITVVCWPLRYPLTKEYRQNEEGEFVRVGVAPPPDVRHAELARAVEHARKINATFLILPELSVADEDLPELQRLLGQDEAAVYPILTVAGLSHKLVSTADVNECLVLASDGELLHRHRKLTRYGRGDGESFDWVEGTVTGTELAILESPVGNLTSLICLDLFHEQVAPLITGSHANVLLVPSLSPKTSAHQTAAKRFLAANAATTIVCNRWFEQPDQGRAGTFVLLPGKTPDGKTTLVYYLSPNDDALVCRVE